ncbi:hypothetical protein ACFE04_006972 [Oxalis oulophora]
MDHMRARKLMSSSFVEKRAEYHQNFSQGSNVGKKSRSSYFGLESLLLLVLLAASLLILPLVLPPLPPPPFMFLLIPIGILVLLMVIAFMPSNVKDGAYTYV